MPMRLSRILRLLGVCLRATSTAIQSIVALEMTIPLTVVDRQDFQHHSKRCALMPIRMRSMMRPVHSQLQAVLGGVMKLSFVQVNTLLR
jgi:hypothetical protein